MKCPLCPDDILEPTYHRGIEIDVCPGCRGMWLDRGELDRLLGDDLVTDSARPRSGEPAATPGEKPSGNKASKKDRKRRLADRLGDVFEELLDL